MEPLPETEEALEEYLEEDDSDLRQVLVELGHRAVSLVPSCVGLSLGLIKDGLTFTLVATSEEVAAIDAAQYLDGGPCVEVTTAVVSPDLEIPDLLDERRWSAFAQASAAEGIRSTLSLPLALDGKVIGGVNLYAAEPYAFQDLHEALATALGASAVGAVTDADLGFASRSRAVETPTRMAEQRAVDVAVGILASSERTDVDSAKARLEDSAARAGVSLVQAARIVSYLRKQDS